MEKKIIKVIFDNDLNYKILNEETLRLGSSRSVEMWFNFENKISNVTYRLNALLPNNEELGETLSDIHEDEENSIWIKWKIDKQYTKFKGRLLISLSAFSNDDEEIIYKTEPLEIYCNFSVDNENEAEILTPTEYENLLYALSKKADLDDDGVVPRSQLPETLGRSKSDSETTNIDLTMVHNYDYCYKATNITNIVLRIPDTISQGYVSSLSFKSNAEVQTDVSVKVPEGFEVIYMQNGIKTPMIIIPLNCAIIISVIYDGLYIYVFEKETDLD